MPPPRRGLTMNWCAVASFADCMPAGMVGQLENGIEFGNESWLYVALAVVGGFFGGYLGSVKMNNNAVRYLLAFVLLLASIKLFLI